MRKRIILVLITLILLATLVACNDEKPSPQISGIEREGLIYTLSDDEKYYSIAAIETDKEEHTVLSEIEGIPVTEVAYAAFSKSTAKKIVLPPTITRIAAYAFEQCLNLEEVVFSENIETIDVYAFLNCENLKTVKLPDNLKTIKKYAFLRCKSLEELFINSELRVIETEAFSKCGRIEKLHISDTASWCSIEIENPETNPITISDNIYIDGEITEVLKIENVEIISDFAFYKLSGIKTIIIGDGVNTIGASAFSNCTSVEKIYISDTVERIETSAFNSCENVHYISVGKKVNHFGGLAFYGCKKLQILDIQDLTSWCSAFFYTDNSGTANPMRYADKIYVKGVDQTNDLILPNTVKTIKTLAFISFPGTQITLPASLKSVEQTAFYQTNIKTVYYLGNAANWRSITFEAYNFNEDTSYELRKI